MSLLTCVEIRGVYKKNQHILKLLQDIKLYKRFLFEDNKIIIGIMDDEDFAIDTEYFEVDFSTENEYFNFISDFKKLSSIYIGIKIDKELHYFTFFLTDENTINFTIDGNRKKIDERYTDFSWYYKNLIKELINDNFQIESISYSDN